MEENATITAEQLAAADADIEPKIAAYIAWAARLMRTRYDGRARSIGLTRAQWRAIVTISVNPGTSQREVANLLEINSVTAGRTIDRLEAAGLVERRADPRDRRAHCLFAKPEALPLQNALNALAKDEEEIALAGLTPDERTVMLTLLRRVVANLQAAPSLPAVPVEEEDEEKLAD